MNQAFLLNRAHLSRVNWRAIAVFYALACGLSYGLHGLPDPLAGILPRHSLLTYGLGPITAALVTRWLFPSVPHRITWLGHKPHRTLLFVGTPLLLGTVAGVANRAGQNPHLYGLLVVVAGILYGLVEEVGWRGFLQDALRPLPLFWRVLLIGVMWLGWHFTFLPDLSAIAGPTTPVWGVFALLVLASWGFGDAAERTRSVLVVACLHETFNLVGSSVVLGMLLLVWTLLLVCWNRPLRLTAAFVQGRNRASTVH